jgi:hypothetical protein
VNFFFVAALWGTDKTALLDELDPCSRRTFDITSIRAR